MLVYISRLEREKAVEKKVEKHLDSLDLARYDIKVIAQGVRKRIFTKC